MPLAASLQTIISNTGGLAALVVVLVAGIIAIAQMARHRIIGLVLVIATAAIVYLAIKGNLIVDVSNWFTQIGL